LHGRLWLWNLPDGRDHNVTQTHLGIRSVSYSPDGQTLSLGGYRGTASIVDSEGGPKRSWPAHALRVNDVALSPDGKTLATASQDRTVRFWDVATGKEGLVLQRGDAEPWSVAFRPDGNTLAVGYKDGSAVLRDIPSSRDRLILGGHAVSDVAFSPDGKSIATANWDRTVCLWDASDGRRVATLKGHEHAVKSLAFSPDGKTLATCDGDEGGKTDYPSAVRLWDLPGGRLRSVIPNPGGRL